MWGDDGGSDSDGSNASVERREREWDALRDRFVGPGYRDGLDLGRDSVVQEGMMPPLINKGGGGVAVVGVWARVCGNLWRLPRAPADALFTSPNCGWCPGFNAGYETGSLAARTVGAVHGMLSVLELMVTARSDSYVRGGGGSIFL